MTGLVVHNRRVFNFRWRFRGVVAGNRYSGGAGAMSRSNWSRRQFLSRSLAAAGVGAGFAIGGTKSSGRVIGANDTVRVAVAGLNGRGSAHVSGLAGRPGVEIAYLVDPDTRT